MKEKKTIIVDGKEIETEVEICKPSRRKAKHGKLTSPRYQKKCVKHHEEIEQLMDYAAEQLPEIKDVI